MIYRQILENKIRYIVHLKNDFHMPNTTIKREFCGFIENITRTHIYFRLHGCGGFVIIPHDKIEWMAPSQTLWEAGYKNEE